MKYLAFSIICSAVLGSVAAAAPQINYDFCTVDAVAARSDQAQIWGAGDVQRFGRQLLANPAVIDSPRAAYPLAYVALTHERDVQRCGGSLSSDDRNQRLIGDLLADLMSRWLMKSVAVCSEPGFSRTVDSGLCAAVQRQKAPDTDSLKATVDTTAVYLSSHMGMALVAVIFDDPFWNQEYSAATHCAPYAPCGQDVLEARLAIVAQYKELYDKNNAFLAVNLPTVIDTLHDACYLKGRVIQAGARFAALFPTAEVFGNIRDETFAAALSTARSIAPSEHPFIVRRGGLNTVQYTEFRTFSAMPPALLKAEHHARSILAGDGLTWVFRGFGSLDGSSLTKLKPSTIDRCYYPELVD